MSGWMREAHAEAMQLGLPCPFDCGPCEARALSHGHPCPGCERTTVCHDERCVEDSQTGAEVVCTVCAPPPPPPAPPADGSDWGSFWF